MASLTDEIADALARDALRAAEEIGDENLIAEVSRVIGASSTTTQEAFMTFVRVRLSEQRARRLIAEKVGADWPLALATSGAVAVQVVAAPPAVAAPVATAPVEPRPVRPQAIETPLAPPVPVQAPTVQEVSAPVPSVQATAAIEGPVDEELLPETPSDPQQAVAEEAQVAAEVKVSGAGVIRPRMPTPPPKPVAPPMKKSFEAALMLATSLPRKPLPQPERTYSAEPLEPGLEVPDGDWG